MAFDEDDVASEFGEDQEYHDDQEGAALIGGGAGKLRRRGWPKALLVLAAAATGLALGLVAAGSAVGSRLDAGVASGVELGSQGMSSEYCVKMLRKFRQVHIARLDWEKKTLDTQTNAIPSYDRAAKLLMDPKNNFAHIGRCDATAKSVVWLYTDESADRHRGGAFLLTGAECERQEKAAFEIAECIAIYRVRNGNDLINVLHWYHGPNSILHAVIGGHGSDEFIKGSLTLSHRHDAQGNVVAHEGLTADMAWMSPLVKVLKERLHGPTATVFLDSCFGAINGMARALSTAMPDIWIFGGVVSLTSRITVHATHFSGGADGPVRVVSELSTAKTVDPATRHKVPGLRFPIGGTGPAHLTATDTFRGERIGAWRSGQYMGCVTQWKSPSANNKVVRLRSRVKLLSDITAYRLESEEAPLGMSVFPVRLLQGMTGMVSQLNVFNGVPMSGDAFVSFNLPANWKQSYDGGLAFPVIVRREDFNKLDVTA